MTFFTFNNQPVSVQVLQRLFLLRNIAIIGQILTVIGVHFGLQINLPLPSIFSLIFISIGFNIYIYQSIKSATISSELEVSLHLAFDAFLLFALLYFCGGFTNPFVSLLLVHIALAASFLSPLYCYAIVILTATFYTLLTLVYLPLVPQNNQLTDIFNLHLSGMWISFIFSAFLMTAFISTLRQLALKREEKLSRAREKMLQNEHIVLLGSVSAGLAHEINTPLSSINMLLTEMEHSKAADPWIHAQIPLLRQQTQMCIEYVKELAHSSQQSTVPNEQNQQPLLTFSQQVLKRWAAMRPEVQYQEPIIDTPDFIVHNSKALSQVIINLLNNGADASCDNKVSRIDIGFKSDARQLLITIDDYGKGLTQQQLEQAGKLKKTTKKYGLGIGLVLSHATLELIGGTLLLQARDNGTRATITINTPKKHD
jgi:two-component system sensor histidine kinase RegB